MIDGMTKDMKDFCKEVKTFYTSELIYHNQFLPPQDSLNQVYFPVCKYTLDVDGLIYYLNSLGDIEDLQEYLDISLFNKDKETVFSLLFT